MKEFSLTGFAAFLGELAVVAEAEHHALEHAAVIVEAEAKRVIGTYDYGWSPLAEATLASKTADTPLLETGEMRDSIEHTTLHEEAFVGSNNDKAIYHELGTAKIPARSFLMGAAVHTEAKVVNLVGRTMVAHLSNEALPKS